MTKTMLMKRATHCDDAAAVKAITHRAYAKWVPLLGRQPLPMTVDYRQAVIDHRIDLLSDAGGEVVGLLEVVPAGDHLVIENVCVDPVAQGRGYGRVLMAHAEQIARDLGFSCIKLYTNKLFAENLAFYEKLGYAREREEAFKGGFIVHMSKKFA